MTKADLARRYFRRTLPDTIFDMYLKLITAASRGEITPCTSDPELWWSTDPGEIRAAKLACRSCPIQNLCLQYAVEGGEPGGVWGGADVRERSLIRKRMNHMNDRKPVMIRELTQ